MRRVEIKQRRQGHAHSPVPTGNPATTAIAMTSEIITDAAVRLAIAFALNHSGRYPVIHTGAR
jgi:hypothetical protein